MRGRGRGNPDCGDPAPEKATNQEGPRFLAVGEALSSHGVRGQIRVRVLTDFPNRLKSLRKVYVGESHLPYDVEAVRVLPDKALLKLKGVESPEAARELAHQLIYVPVAEAMPLPEDEYYWYQVIGLAVWTTAGRYLGEVIDIISTGSNDVYVVRGPEGEVLVPAIEDVIISIDLKDRKLTIEPMEGML